MSNDTLVTLGRSDAILAADIVELYIKESKDIMPKEGVWSGFAISKNEMPFVAQTVLMGGNPRVGLEDNLYLSIQSSDCAAICCANGLLLYLLYTDT